MSSPRVAVVALLLTVVALAVPAAASAIPHTYVSGVGDDANPCTMGAECRTWAGAISKTDAGGTISAIDSGAFGTVSVTKSITIDGGGFLAGTLATGQNGIIVNATGGDVVLEGLTLDSPGICTAGAFHGVRFLKGNSLAIRDSRISGFRGSGVSLEPSDGHGTVMVRDSIITNNCAAAVTAAPPVPSDMSVLVEDDLLTGNLVGVDAAAGSALTYSGNTIVGNGTPATSEGGGALSSLGDNRIGGVAGTPGFLPSSPQDPTTDGPATTAVPATVVAPLPPRATTPTAARCRVPKLTFRSLAGGKRRLARAHCAAGTVRFVVKRGVRRDRVYGQSLATGRLRAGGTKVSFRVSGRAPRTTARSAAVIGSQTRVWVNPGGSDVNTCSRTAPCLTFAEAVTKLAQNGIVNVAGDGDYGPVTIDHSLTINGAGAAAAIDVSSGSAITVAAGADEKVTLAHLALSTTAPCGAPGAGDGITVRSGGPLEVDGVTATGFPDSGIALAGGVATIQGGSLTDNCTAGVSAAATTATVEGTVLTGNGTGIVAADGATVQLTASDVHDNAVGFTMTGSGQIQGWPANTFGPNAVPGFTPGTLPLS
jgi:hypothetical protein